jgi:CRP/FNR family cyclic AMP-dependent transcriptional regulator
MPAFESAALDRKLAELPAGIAALARQGCIRTYRKNTVIVQEGEAGDSMYVLIEGRVRIYSNGGGARREITFDTVHAPDYFGETWLDGGPRATSFATLEPCICSVLSRADLQRHISQHHGFAFELMARMAKRTRLATQMAKSLALTDVYGRLVQALEAACGQAPPQVPVTLSRITHQSLASSVGASREMVSRLLKDLERGGYVSLGVRQITLRRKLPARY